MASLYELTAQARMLQEMLEGGEIDEEVFNDTLENLDIDTKIENICKVIRNLEAEATAFKEEKDRLAARQKTAENGVARLKESLLNYMVSTGNTKVKAGLFTVSKGTSKSLQVNYLDMIPSEYMIPQPETVDKKGITEAIKAGKKVPGAELVENSHIRIR